MSIRRKLLIGTIASVVTIAGLGLGSNFGCNILAAKLEKSRMVLGALRNHTNSDMMHDALRADVYASLYSSSTRPERKAEILAETHDHAQEFTKLIADNRALPLPEKIKASLSNIEEPLKAYIAIAESLVGEAFEDRHMAEGMLADFDSRFSLLETAMDEAGNEFEAYAKNEAEAADAVASRAQMLSLMALSIGLAVGAFLVWVTLREVLGPLLRITSAMQDLAKGNFNVVLPGLNRKDEIGEIAHAVEEFKLRAEEKAAAERARLTQEAHAQRDAENKAAQQAAAESQRLADEAQARRESQRKAEAEAIGRERAMVSNSIGVAVAKLAAKDLSVRLTDDLPEAYRKLQREFNSALEQFEAAMQQVIASSEAMKTGTQEIASAADDLSRRTENQAASLEETAAALEQITVTVRKSAEGAAHARDTVATAKNAAETSREVVRQAVDAMSNIENSSKQIGQIIGVIDEIAFQTNLLALNAGVEAARAGEAGRGFAVVASEVRALAQRSAEAAKEIKTLISISSGQVEQGARYVSESGKTFEQIIAHVVGINHMIGDIAKAAEEQASGLQQINTAINSMDQMTQQNASMVEETTAACHSLMQETSQLSDLVGEFRVNQHSGASVLRHAAAQMLATHSAIQKPNAAKAGHEATRRPVLKAISGTNGSAAARHKAEEF